MVPVIQLTHKKQTRANDCWYACMQMLKTHRAGGVKTKVTGPAMQHHRNRGVFSGFWGNDIGSNDGDFAGVLAQNNLRDISTDIWESGELNSINRVQNMCDRFGPVMVGGRFGQVLRVRGTSHWMIKRQGHYIVVVGANPYANTVIVHNPWRSHRTEMPIDRFARLVWQDAEVTAVALA